MPVQQIIVKNSSEIENFEWNTVPYMQGTRNGGSRAGSTSSQTSNSNSSGDICRICHCESDAQNPLLAPCYCSGKSLHSCAFNYRGCKLWYQNLTWNNVNKQFLFHFLFSVCSKMLLLLPNYTSDISNILQFNIIFTTIAVSTKCIVNIVFIILFSGSLKYVHQSCLQQWLTASDTRSCELCKFHFIMHTKIKPFNEVH